MGKNKEENFHGEAAKHFYLGNKTLPRGDMEFQWTPEMVKDLEKSRKNIIHFAEKFFYIVNLDQGRMTINLHKCQKRVMRALKHNRFICLLASRQVGKTTMMTIYCMWIACFQEDQRILIVANKEQTAINIFRRVRLAYEMLPNWLKPGVIEYGKTSMQLSNGSSIGISTTTSDAGRGDSCNVLILDELAFIPTNLIEDFWKAVFPIISSSKKSKIFIASTPNGTENLFYNLYTNAVKGDNNWRAERIDWWEVPGRDEDWKDDTMKALGSKEAFQQEFENVFLESGETAIDEILFEKLKKECTEPEWVFEEGNYKMWEEPNPNNLYAMGVDVSEGVNEAATVVQVLDITDPGTMKQVAVYHNRKISPYMFTSKLFELCQHWGMPPILIERNNCGAQVVDQFVNVLGYPHVVSYASKAGNLTASTTDVQRPGVLAHTNTKYRGVMNMRYWLNELRALKIQDIDTLRELKTFVRHANGTWSGKDGLNVWDDRVMSLMWTLMILEPQITEKYFEILDYDDYKKPKVIAGFPDYYGEKQFINPVHNMINEKEVEGYDNILPVLIQNKVAGSDPMHDDIQDLMTKGWKWMGQ
jgi:hypothetical protein